MKLSVLVLPSLLLFACGEPEAAQPKVPPPSASAAPQVSLPTSPSVPPAASQSAPPTAPPAATPERAAPHLVFEKTVLDFGEVWDTEELRGKFAFTNEGEKALMITDIKPSCGCTTTQLERKRFEPGESDALELVWSPRGFGSQSKTITVQSNSVGPGIEVLSIRASIKPFAKFSQNPLALGEVRAGEVHATQVTLSCADPKFELIHLQTSHPNVTAKAGNRLADGSIEIDVTLDEGAPWGLFTCSVQATVRGQVPDLNETRDHVSSLQISASIFGDLRMQPTLFSVGHVLPGKTFERRSRLTHVAGAPFKVMSADVLNAQPPGLAVCVEPFPKGQGEGYELILSGDAKDYIGLIRGTVTVTTDILGESPREIAVFGIVRE